MSSHNVIANDEHGTVLLDRHLERDGRQIHYRVNHTWQIRDGLFTRWDEWPGDDRAFNDAWS